MPTKPKLPQGWKKVTKKETKIAPRTKRVRIIAPIKDNPAVVGQVYRMPNAEANDLIYRGYAEKVFRSEAPVRATAPTASAIIEELKTDG